MDNVREMCAEALCCLEGLSVFSGIKKKPIVKSLIELMATVENPSSKPRELIRMWAEFSSIFARESRGRTFFMMLTDAILADENTFTLQAERGEFLENSYLYAFVSNDIRRLSIVGDFDIPMLTLHITDELWKAGLEDSARFLDDGVQALGKLKEKNFALDIEKMPYSLLASVNLPGFAAYIRQKGAGLLGRHCFFSWQQKRGLVPALNPDYVQLADLSGYEDQHRIVVDNTRRLLERRGANNLLLYGDRGTGKSATVKAVCNEFKEQGLRLIEIRRQELVEIPRILSVLSTRGLCFVLFIDDLSFETQNNDFTMLKGLLEGGIEAKPKNVVVYATSNRRHFVKEKFSDRPQSSTGDVRSFDTMQEQLSLADRFGVTVVFTAPNQDEFIQIAEFLAEKRGLFSSGETAETPLRPPLDREQFRKDARKWERWFNGRSPRTAVQFVEWAAGGAEYPWE